MARKPVPRKRTITETITDVSPYELECSLADLQAKITEWIAEHGPTARLDWDAHFYYDYDPNPSPRFNIKRDREETDEELKQRLEAEAVQQNIRDAQERAEFERLAAKFGKDK